MVRAGEIEHSELIAERAEEVWRWRSAAGRLRAQRRARLIIDAAEIGPGTDVLEVGCGTGAFTGVFAETRARVVAIDVSAALLDQAIARETCGGVTFRIEDAEAMSSDNESFDAVVGSSILHHLDVARSIDEMYRVLRPGGRIAFAEPNMMNPHIVFERTTPVIRRWMGVSPEETAFFRWRLAAQLRKAGFDEVRVEPFDFLHPAVPRTLIPVVRGVGGLLERIPLAREIAGSLIISARR